MTHGKGLIDCEKRNALLVIFWSGDSEKAYSKWVFYAVMTMGK